MIAKLRCPYCIDGTINTIQVSGMIAYFACQCMYDTARKNRPIQEQVEMVMFPAEQTPSTTCLINGYFR